LAQSNTAVQNAWARPAVFLALVWAVSLPVYWYLWGHPQALTGKLALGLFWWVGAAAALTMLIFKRPLRELGLRWPGWRWMALSYAIPMLSAGVVWLVALLRGRGIPPVMAQRMAATGGGHLHNPVLLALGGLAGVGVVLFAMALFGAMGDELGWRGLLAPLLVKRMGWKTAGLLSGVLWMLWDLPLFVMEQRRGTGLDGLSVASFVVTLVASSVVFLWLRLKTASFWPCAVLHASYSAWAPRAWADAHGLGMAAMTVLVAAWVGWRYQVGRRSEIRFGRPGQSIRPAGK
jgi:membrane protease YdiL (CAAX protease family)